MRSRALQLLRPARAVLFFFAVALLGRTAVARPRSGPIPRASGAAMCGALTQQDFAAVALPVNARADANVQDNGQSAYCVFRGRSGATGGVELDVFWPAGGNPAEVSATLQTVLGEDAGTYVPVQLPGADEARLATGLQSEGVHFAAIVVRRHDLVLTISLPAGPQARAQLQRLAATALSRLT